MAQISDKELVKSTKEWVAFLKDGLIDDSVNDETVDCLVKHLADLDLFNIAGEDLWKLCSDKNLDSEECIKKEFIQKFGNVRQSEAGSLLKYFTGEKLNDEDYKFPEDKPDKPELDENKISSNLSNYQIVRKMGRQLSPFIELENTLIKKLEGPHVTRADAKVLFKYILSRIQTREKPREWEQISRRRHK